MLKVQWNLLKTSLQAASILDVAGVITGTTSMILASWTRAICAQTIMVDGHALSGGSAILVYVLFCGGLALYSAAYFALWRKGSLSMRQIRTLAYGLAILFSFMLPFLSNDIFSLFAYGELANNGTDIYGQTLVNPVSFFRQYCNADFGNGPDVYGPFLTGMLRLTAYFFSHNMIGALVFYKLLMLCFAFVFIEVACRTASFIKAPTGLFLLVVLNPVFLLQGLGQLHSDLVAAALGMCLVFSVLKGRFNVAFLFAAFAIAVKVSYIVTIPYLLLALYINKHDNASFFSKTLIGALILCAGLGFLYYPYFTSIATILIPLHSVYDQIPTKSIPEVFGDIIFYIQGYFSGNLSAGNTFINDAGQAVQKASIWRFLETICRLTALISSCVLLFHFFKAAKSERNWMKIYLRLLLLFLLFYSHVIYPWYLIIIVPFMWIEEDVGFIKWLIVLTCFCNAQSIMCAIDRSSPLYWSIPPFIALNVFVFLWRFRRNFLSIIN